MTYWLRCALIRAIKTIAQTAVATIGTAVALSAVDWRLVVSASLLAGVLSLLTSVAGLPEVDMMAEADEDDIEEDEDEDEDEDDEDIDGYTDDDPEDDEELPQ